MGKEQGQTSKPRSKRTKRAREEDTQPQPQPQRGPNFRNEVHRQRWEAFQRGHTVISGRIFPWHSRDFYRFCPRVRRWLEESELFSIFSLRNVFYPDLVAEFYSGLVTCGKDLEGTNIEYDSEGLLWRMNRNEYSASEEEIGRILNVPSSENKDIYYTLENLAFWNTITGLGNTRLPRNLLTGAIKDVDIRVLCHFIATSVICKKGSFSLLSNKELYMVEQIIVAKEKGYTFNWAQFFLDSIKWTPLNKKEKEKIVLPFGRIISLILESKGLVPAGHPCEKGTVYDKSNFSLMGIHVVETQEKKADGTTWKWTDHQMSKRRDTLKSLREQFGGEDSDDIDRVVEEGAVEFQQ